MSKARMLFGMVGKNRCKGLLKRVEIVIFLGRAREDRRICRCSRKAAARVSGSVCHAIQWGQAIFLKKKLN